MNSLIEPLIVYMVLFFPSSIPQALPPAEAEFSVFSELSRVLLYDLPSMALIWYLLFKTRPPGSWGQRFFKKNVFFSALVALPILFFIAVSVSLCTRILDMPLPPVPVVPAMPVEWAILALSCMSAAYLEESFFRFYLLNRLETVYWGLSPRIFLSALLFAVCHTYEGPLGALNAALAGLALGFIFTKYRSLHGIAWAHGIYNFAVFVLSTKDLSSLTG